jgi:hypothetical protein
MFNYQYLHDYWRDLREDGIALMSGSLGVLLAFLAAYFQWVANHGRAALWLCAFVAFLIASYRLWRKERQKVEALKTKYEARTLILEIDQRRQSSTNIRVEQTQSATRIFVTLDFRLDNRGDYPCYMKSVKVALHRRGDAEPIWMWFAFLRATNNGKQIATEDVEPMRVDGHQLTGLYSVVFMLGTPETDEGSAEPLNLDANYFLRVSMEPSGFQPMTIADLNPYWTAALCEGGTNQICIIGDASLIPEDYSRIG